jgi:hypothetical protein
VNRLAPPAPGVALALAATVALALAGCGSSPLSTSALRTRATRVCQLANGRAGRIPAPTVPAQATAFLNRGIAVLRPELRALDTLRPGGQAAHVYATALDAVGRELTLIKATTASLGRGGDPVIAIKTLQRQLAPLEAQENQAWETLDIPACTAQ